MKLEQISNAIVQYRAKHNISINEFAKRCKVSDTTIRSIEKCIQKPSRLTLAKIMEVIDND